MLNRFINLGVQVKKGLLRLSIEPIERQGQRLHPISEDAICLRDMYEPSSGDNLITTAIVVRLPNDVCPINQFLGEFSIGATSGLQFLIDDLSLNRFRGVLLLQSNREPFEECLIQHVGADETTIVRTLTLGVCRSNDCEARCRVYPLAYLLDIDTGPLKDRL